MGGWARVIPLSGTALQRDHDKEVLAVLTVTKSLPHILCSHTRSACPGLHDVCCVYSLLSAVDSFLLPSSS
ncbi:putative Reverse transcriptase [Fusarium oxysporum f. sp. albedinis]|nr:Uncharacterized protein HZ326_26427 [Fusarium oxysporum f. sp. albedinis]KAJ0131261.1 putative Reverse transcriptase [Fusarium oxysporum f. sp. albedinis]